MIQEPGLQLDDRQRAMLEAMHIKVWQPPARSVAVTASPPASSTDAIKSIAIDAYSTGAESIKDSVKPSKTIPVATRQPATLPTALSAATGLMQRPDGIDHMDWTQLEAAVSGCRACALCESRKNTVFGVGQVPASPGLAPQVDWMIVGEAPGENEDLRGEPFVGQAGKLLDNMLRAIGLDRHHNVYIANVLKCRPPANRNPEPHEVAQCAPYLQRQIELLQPKVILAMGRFAIQSLLQTTEPVGKLRGRAHQYHGVPVIATYHPAYLLRNLP
ncbi:MAG TPA: uracil-DNA glycosylase, partial [Burkholderiaceae bacterium]|nr:uracil-DNA glycosylase [Burkholderiaceae bacterium]